MQGSARYQEGEDPPEDAAALIREADGVLDELEDLIRRINRTNARTVMEGGGTLTDAIARRDGVGTRTNEASTNPSTAAGNQPFVAT